MSDDVQAVTFNVSSLPPLGAMMGVQPVSLLTGIADDPSGGLRAYLGARYKGLYVLIEDDEGKEQFRRAWGHGNHIWVWPPPPADAILCDRIPVAVDPQGAKL